MAILAECPLCHKKQSAQRKVCKCGADLVKEKRAKRVRYWVNYRDPDGKQRREYVGSFKDMDGYSVEDARNANAKRTVQKAENRLLDVKEDTKMTFHQLTEWYLSLERIKALSSYPIIKLSIEKFNREFGNRIVSTVKLADLENYQAKRRKEGMADGTIDHETGKTKTMIVTAFHNDMISGDTMKAFSRVKKLVSGNENARDRVLSLEEYQALHDKAPKHLKPILATAFYAGMRRGEILSLQWNRVDLRDRVIRLRDSDTKTGRSREIPICDDLLASLKGIPRSIHDDHVFLFRGKPVRDIRTGLREACAGAGIPYGRSTEGGFVFHDLRHSFVTHMRKAGLPESVIMAVSGHSTRAMFDRYNRIDNEDTRRAVDEFQGYLRSVDQSVDQVEEAGN